MFIYLIWGVNCMGFCVFAPDCKSMSMCVKVHGHLLMSDGFLYQHLQNFLRWVVWVYAHTLANGTRTFCV